MTDQDKGPHPGIYVYLLTCGLAAMIFVADAEPTPAGIAVGGVKLLTFVVVGGAFSLTTIRAHNWVKSNV